MHVVAVVGGEGEVVAVAFVAGELEGDVPLVAGGGFLAEGIELELPHVVAGGVGPGAWRAEAVAALPCLSVPWGTLLGVMTLIILARPMVAAQFDRATAGTTANSLR